jgi:catechol 2,3-dioxygenase-like lactoylglutathione lyase family enzyme
VLNTKDAFSSFSVTDLEKAQRFYGNTLGFKVERTEQGLELAVANGAKVFLYPKKNHAPASFTVLTLPVDDVDGAVEALTKKGVTFETYDMPEMKTDAKGIARTHGMALAWFKDPFGNVVSVIGRK